MLSINGWLDRLPRATVHLTGAESPAFRAIGVTGFAAALATMIGGALLRGLPVAVAVIVALVSAASFFGWALLRRLVTGRESLVLLEHVWFAGACVLVALRWLDRPALVWLDVFAVALSVFLAAGRYGCAVAGCCHGHPAGVGIRYPDDHPEPRIAGLRLFPAPLIEGAGLVVIAVTGMVALPFAAPGAVLVWALAAYAVLRFGVEGLRGDPRPHVWGVPVARLAAGLQLAAAMAVDTVRSPDPSAWRPVAIAAAGLAAAGVLGLFWYHRRPRPVTAEHAAQVRAALIGARADVPGAEPSLSRLPDGITVATTGAADGVHLSVGGDIGVPARRRLARAAAGGLPVVVGPRGVAHVFEASAGPAAPFTLPVWLRTPTGSGDVGNDQAGAAE